MNKTALIILTLIFFLNPLKSQTYDIRFNRISINEGLSLSSIYCILQDNQGFMWFGTEDGLNKYNGYDFEIFRPDYNNPNSLSDKWTKNIFEDSKNNLWIVTENGLNKYTPTTGFFHKYTYDKNNPNSISSNNITTIYESIKGEIWFGTDKGLNKYNPLNNNFEVFSFTNENTNTINYITEDDENNLWLATNEGLVKFSTITNLFETKYFTDVSNEIRTVFIDNNIFLVGTKNGLINLTNNNSETFVHLTNNDNSISENSIRTIFKDSKDNIWIGTDHGFDIFNIDDKTFKNIIHENQTESNSAIRIDRPIFEDSEGIIWLGSYNSGLFRYDSNNKTLKNYKNDPLNPNSISENGVNSILQDKYGILWFGTFGAGLNTYDPSSKKFELFVNDPNNKNSLSENFIWSVWEDTDGEIWIGTNSHGVNRYNPTSKTFTHYINIHNNKNSLSNNSAREIYQTSDGVIWFGTDGGGLNKFDKRTNKFEIFKHSVTDTNSISSNSVRVIFEDSKNNLWIGTTNGLNLFNRQNKTFKKYLHNPNDTNSISNNFIYSSIYEDNDGYLWIGTYGGGLNKFDPVTEKFTSYQKDFNNPNSLSDNKVFSIIEDNAGNFWVGTNSALDLFDKNTGKFTHYTTSNGLPNNTIYGIMPEKDKNVLWLTTNYGISKFNFETNEFVNFTNSDGLQSNEFNGGAFHKGSSGKIYAAGVSGLNIFNPDNIKYNKTPPDVLIVNLQIFVKDVRVLDQDYITKKDDNKIKRINDEYFLPLNIEFTKEVTLNYTEKVISFEFVGLHFSNPENNNYSYRLKNFNDEWININKRRYVTYTNLKPGEYYFEVKASNSDGVWSNQIKSIKVIITPPFWQTWWFRIVSALSVIFIILSIIRIRERNLIRQKAFLEAKVIERTKELTEKSLEIVKQRDKIAIQNQQITDSINYAQKIQIATLPSEEYISKILKNHFIFFKPRDVVSGDFYWIKEIIRDGKKHNLIVAADSTGHGVPGAFVSMLGISLLNELIRHEQIKTLSDFLNELRQQFKSSLKQVDRKSSTQDGIELSVILFEDNANKIQFAGANNPIYLIRNNELIIHKGDKQPIGIYFKEKPFTEKEIDVQKNDLIYMFSDGYMDQFGGKTNSKLTSRRFKEILLSHSNKTMNSQKENIEKDFLEWKGANEQIDDVLVIGIQF